ncbi:hypothetical protein, partial [Streptomyces sp. NPDC127105]|uniref:hypothetical protein n=1 Tax=Streptomyces sp. NPDC127105 TaxID=3345359 RepID=UPI003646D2C7
MNPQSSAAPPALEPREDGKPWLRPADLDGLRPNEITAALHEGRILDHTGTPIRTPSTIAQTTQRLRQQAAGAKTQALSPARKPPASPPALEPREDGKPWLRPADLDGLRPNEITAALHEGRILDH